MSAHFCFSVGKTLAYAIPIVQDLQSMSPNISRVDGPYAVVVTPTREVGHTLCVCACVCVCTCVPLLRSCCRVCMHNALLL